MAGTNKVDIEVKRNWCKGCGICIEFCPKDVLGWDEEGKVKVVALEDCIDCKLCELRCPEYSIFLLEKEGHNG